MIINKTDIGKFSWSEVFANMNGKTSNTAVCGFFMVVMGVICFTMGVVKFTFFTTHIGFETVLLQSLALVTLGTTLIMTKKLSPTQDTTNTEIIEKENNSENNQ